MVEGIGTVLVYPDSVLPLIALGLFLSLWRIEGLLRAWPVALAAQAAGILAAPALGPWVALAAMGAGIVAAVLAALAPQAGRGVALALTTAVSVLVTAAMFQGHGLFELPVGIHLGLLLGINAALALAANLARLMLERSPVRWMPVALRVVASWVAAILVLYLAFVAKGA